MTNSLEENYPDEVRIKLGTGGFLDVEGLENHMTFVIQGTQLNKIFTHHQNSLFNWNIRKFLKHGSSINRRISETIVNSPETFYYLNNGISALCDNFELNKVNRELIIKRLQIVNGMQTIGAIGSISVQEHFSQLSKTQVLVKLTAVKQASNEKVIAGAIIRANNTHNLITPSQKQHWEEIYMKGKDHVGTA